MRVEKYMDPLKFSFTTNHMATLVLKVVRYFCYENTGKFTKETSLRPKTVRSPVWLVLDIGYL